MRRHHDKRRERPQGRAPRQQQPPAHAVKQQRGHHRATDAELQKWIYRQHGFIPQRAWITACKKDREGTSENTCPPEHRDAIESALRHFGLR